MVAGNHNSDWFEIISDPIEIRAWKGWKFDQRGKMSRYWICTEYIDCQYNKVSNFMKIKIAHEICTKQIRRLDPYFFVLPSSYFIHIECAKYDILCKNCIELKWFKSMQQSVFFFRSHVAWDTDFPFILGGPLEFLLFEHIFRSTQGNRISVYKSQNCLPLSNTYTGDSDTSKRVQNMWVGKYVCQNDWKTFNKWSVERLTVNHSPTAEKGKRVQKIKPFLFGKLLIGMFVLRTKCFWEFHIVHVLMLIVGCWLWCVLLIFFFISMHWSAELIGEYISWS